MDAQKRNDSAALEALLSPAFQLVRADGSRETKQQKVANPSRISDYTLSDFSITRQGDTMVVSFTTQTDQVIDGKRYVNDPSPRLAVLVRDADRWLLIAYSNFSLPAD